MQKKSFSDYFSILTFLRSLAESFCPSPSAAIPETGKRKKLKQISKSKTKDCLTTIRDIGDFVSAGICTHLYSKVWHEIITVTFSSKMSDISMMISVKILQNIFIHLSMIWYFSRANPERLRPEQPDCLPVLPDIFVCRSSSRRSCPRRT